MTEPIYTYIPGAGWVVETPPKERCLAFTSHGRQWLIIERKPDEGEIYCYAGTSNDVYNTREGTARLDQWASRYFQWNDPAREPRYSSEYGYTNGVYVTVIPYE